MGSCTINMEHLSGTIILIENERKHFYVRINTPVFMSQMHNLHGFLRTYNAEKNPISDFCKDLGSQGIISKMINGPLGYLEKVSKASSKMLKQFCFSQEVENILKSTSNS